jgi:lysophospholipase L1-like esterase
VRSLLILAVAGLSAPAAQPLDLNDGDRVVWLGNTVIEREQRYGYWETALTLGHPDKNITFRNLGWSGDTVWGEARASFDSPAVGFRRLQERVVAAKPTVIIVGYGFNESFAGKDGLPRFQMGLDTLLDTLTATKARVVVLGPQRHEDLGRPLPDPAENNKNIRLYRDAMRETAKKRGYPFIDLYERLGSEKKPLTDNGIHFTAYGYWRTAQLLVPNVKLPAPRPEAMKLRPEDEKIEKLRELIIEKNFTYFQNWRPQNWTYLFGFRKGEQGQNAKEIPQFEPIIAKLEAEITKRKKEVGK